MCSVVACSAIHEQDSTKLAKYHVKCFIPKPIENLKLAKILKAYYYNDKKAILELSEHNFY